MLKLRPLCTAALAATLAIFAAGCSSGAGPQTAPAGVPAESTPGKPDWARHLSQFQEEYFARNPPFAVQQGRHEFDGKLPDWSRNGLLKQGNWLEAMRESTLAFAPEDLTPTQRFEREYLLARIDNEIFWLNEAEEPVSNPAYYLYGGLDPSVYVTRPYASLEARLAAFVKYARAVPLAARQIRLNLRMPLPRTYSDLGIKGFEGYASFYRNDVLKAFAKVSDINHQAELRSATRLRFRSALPMASSSGSGVVTRSVRRSMSANFSAPSA